MWDFFETVRNRHSIRKYQADMPVEIEKLHIRKVLAHTKGNKTKTAELLGIGLATLYRKIEEYHLG